MIEVVDFRGLSAPIVHRRARHDRGRPRRIADELAAAEELTRRAGFTRFQVHDFADSSNLYYEVRA